MANRQKQSGRKQEPEERSAAPRDWPGIPGRAPEHEAHPESPTSTGEDQKDAEVTESQRELERSAPS